MAGETRPQALHLSRRRLLAGAMALGLGGIALRSVASPAGAVPQGSQAPKHLVWVWQFSTDGEPQVVGARLLANNLGILLKTHDGLQWMSEYDKSPYAVSGPAQAAVLVNYYELSGVPFHAWAVVQGVDPIKEARMAADVLGAGARSIYLDVEPHSGFWRGSPADAEAFGRELRRLQPNGQVVLSLDPRPWILERLPVKQFAAFANEIAPQQYWRTFNTAANYERYALTGFPVGPEGVTPEFLTAVATVVLTPLGLPVTPVGQGAAPDPAEWQRFLDGAFEAGSKIVTAWRYGVTTAGIFSLLRDTPPRLPKPAFSVYVVQPGDTLGAIAYAQGVGLDAIVEANSLANPDYLYIGQELKIPGGSGGTSTSVSAVVPAAAAPASAGRRSYAVTAGDTLYGIGGRYGTTVDAIAQANGLTNPDFIQIGQELVIP